MKDSSPAEVAPKRYICFGLGYVATQLATNLVAEGHTVVAVRRSSEKPHGNISVIQADLGEGPLDLGSHQPFDGAVYTLSAGSYNESAYQRAYVDGLRHALQSLQKIQTTGRFLFTSSTGVYGQSAGEWVDETSPTVPEDFSGQCLLEGEQLLRSFPFEPIALRLGGIYGPGREHLLNEVRSGAETLSSGPAIFTNRIHRDDAAALIQFLLSPKIPPGIYLGVDSEPSERNEVLRWMAEKLGVTLQISAKSTPRRRNKRCSNKKLLAAGFEFRYPTFREGYGALIARASAR